MTLLPMSDVEYRFYYRLERTVAYIPVETVVGFLGDRWYRATDLVAQVRRELPLYRHTDIFVPFLKNRSASQALRYVLAAALEHGEASLWDLEDGFVGQIEVEWQNTGCSTGRNFRGPKGNVILSVSDSDA